MALGLALPIEMETPSVKPLALRYPPWAVQLQGRQVDPSKAEFAVLSAETEL